MIHHIATAALTAAVAAGALTVAPPAPAAATHRECWGSNTSYFAAFHAAVPASHCSRTYYDGVDKFPSVWPVANLGSGTWQMLSIRPSYANLMDGSENSQIHSLCATAPSHSWLTIYQENAGANPLQYPPSVHNAAHYVAMQKKMMQLCAHTRARFGVIIIAPFSSVLNWLYRGDDWFAYDFYAFPRYLNNAIARAQGATFTNANATINVRAVLTRMTNNLKSIQRFTGRRCPMMGLGETNAHLDSQRKTWFSTIATWFATHDCSRVAQIDTRWTNCAPDTPHCGLSGPWPPTKTVVAELRYLAQKYR